MNNRIGASIDGKYISQGCQNCKFWAEHKREGTCSQKIKTTDNILLNQIVSCDYVCSLHEDDDIKTYFNFYIKENGDIAISGTYTKKMLYRMREYLDEKLKGM